MASIAKDPNGRKRILFVDGNGNRKVIRLGKMNLPDAREVKTKVESILSSRAAKNSLDPAVAQWTAEIPDSLAAKLAQVGLIPKRDHRKASTLESFIESYIVRRTDDVSPNTQRIWRQTKRNLTTFFGADKPLAEITRGDATDWRLSLVSRDLADASVRKHCGFAKHFFAQAVDHELIQGNPFAKLVSSPVGNESRQYFVSRDATAKVLDEAPDAEWRLIIALSRYGGLRCPSEHLALTLDDVDWEHGRVHITSPKTKRHAGHESRIIPLFPDLRPYLEAVFDTAPPGTKHFITRYRDIGSNLRTHMTRLVKRAGLEPWPRIFHNLRSSRQTELEEKFPSHVVCKWMGNSQQVARKHYLQTTEEHFERALEGGAESGAHVAQNQAQQGHATNRSGSQNGNDNERNRQSSNEVTRSVAKHCDSTRKEMAEVHGNRTHRSNVCRNSQRF